jgi:hypothetical protein
MGFYLTSKFLTFSVTSYYQILINFEFSRQVLEKYSNTKFHENPFSGSRAELFHVLDGRTDMT